MTLRPLLFALLLFPLAVLAQNTAPTQTLRPAPVQAQRITPVQPAPVAVAPDPSAAQVDTDVVDPQGTIDRLRTQNRKLKADNERLKQDLLRVEDRLEQMTTRSGSAVRAYCENPSTSRNTAGASRACGAYVCDEVSGLCPDRCTTSDQCSGSNRCDTKHHVCALQPLSD